VVDLIKRTETSEADFGSLDLRFHHVGVACRDLDVEMGPLLIMGYHVEENDFIDPIQGVRGRFLSGQSPRLELLVALPGSRVLDPWLKSSARFYHLGYETPSLQQAISTLLARDAILAVEPVQSVAFPGRRIAFLMLPTMLLIELIGP